MTESSEPEPQADDDQLPISNSETVSSDKSGLEDSQGAKDIQKEQDIEESEPIEAEEDAESRVFVKQHSDLLLLLVLFISFRLNLFLFAYLVAKALIWARYFASAGITMSAVLAFHNLKHILSFTEKEDF